MAERLLVSPSKISRLETGQRSANPRDIRDLSDLYEVDDTLRQHLVDLAAEGKQRPWWQSPGLPGPFSTYVGLESAAASISDFGPTLIPGLLQTADYAREVMSAIRPDTSADVIELRAAARIERQRILTSENPPQFDAIIDEAVLRRLPKGRSVVKDQLDRLVAVSALPNVTIRLLPFDAGLLPSSNNKFIILGFNQPNIATTVFIETLTDDLYIEEQDEVQIYVTAFEVMREMSYTPERTREVILSLLARLRD